MLFFLSLNVCVCIYKIDARAVGENFVEQSVYAVFGSCVVKSERDDSHPD